VQGRLSIGTAQFGMSYGIANRSGVPSLEQGAAILESARLAGVDTLDTAISYGTSEQRLGEIGVRSWRITTKLPALGSLSETPALVSQWVTETVNGSLQRLRVPSLYGLLLHRSADLNGPAGEQLVSALRRLRDDGVVTRLGVSIYDPLELSPVLERLPIDIVQAPFNIVDRRLETSGWLDKLVDGGVEVHTRSAFLQGLLLMTASERPNYFQRWHDLWEKWRTWLEQSGLTPLAACAAFVLSRRKIGRIVVGIDSLQQLQEVLQATRSIATDFPSSLACDDPDLVEPWRWPKQQ
jgi:aryl-alcohol dehydrogenase-like predicted oxidoreductase